MTAHTLARKVFAFLYFAALAECSVIGMQSSTEFESLANSFAFVYNVQEVQAGQLQAWQAASKPLLLLDVRQPQEQRVSIIPGAVTTHPGQALAELPAVQSFVQTQADNPDARLVVYCAGGYRSARSIAGLMDRKKKSAAEKLDFEKSDSDQQQEALRQNQDLYRGLPVLNLHGGIIAYANAGGRLVDPETGETVQRIHAYSSYWASFVNPDTQAILEPAVD